MRVQGRSQRRDLQRDGGHWTVDQTRLSFFMSKAWLAAHFARSWARLGSREWNGYMYRMVFGVLKVVLYCTIVSGVICHVSRMPYDISCAAVRSRALTPPERAGRASADSQGVPAVSVD